MIKNNIIRQSILLQSIPSWYREPLTEQLGNSNYEKSHIKAKGHDMLHLVE